MPKGCYRREPKPVHHRVAAVIVEMLLTHGSVTHGDVIERLRADMPFDAAYRMTRSPRLRKALPPGCRMTATHFVFD